jgi:hypothetical protein
MLGVALVTTVGFFWLFVLRVQFRGHTNNISWTVIGPPKKALCPALTALAKAPAMRTGSRARETAVFSSMPSKPHSVARKLDVQIVFEGTVRENNNQLLTPTDF